MKIINVWVGLSFMVAFYDSGLIVDCWRVNGDLLKV